MQEKILGIVLLLLSMGAYISTHWISYLQPSVKTCGIIFSITFFALGIFEFVDGIRKTDPK